MTKKLTRDEKKICGNLDNEIDNVCTRIMDLLHQVGNLQDHLVFLREKKEQLLCPEDTSPEAVAMNEKLLKELKKEQYGSGKSL